MLPEVKYFSPSSLEEAFDILANNVGARILAGGTDLLIELRKMPINEKVVVVDISKLAALRFINEDDHHIFIGPLVTHYELTQSEIIKREFPFLSRAASLVGSPQIRARGTIGGNICNASPAADTVPVLIALDAKAKLKGKNGERVLLIGDFIKGPYKTERKPDEILVEIIIERLKAGFGFSFVKLGRRNALAISRMNVATAVRVDDGIISEVRLACGSVFPVTKRVSLAESFLVGKTPSIELFSQAGEIVGEEMIKSTGIRWSTPYKRPVIAAMVKNSLLEACGMEVKSGTC